MQITIETNDLTCLINGINNALVLYGYDISSKEFGCKCNEKLESISVEESHKRFNEILFVYNQLLKKEEETVC